MRHATILVAILAFVPLITAILFADGSRDWRGVIKWRQRATLLEEPEPPESRVQTIGCFAVVLLVQILMVGAVYYALESGSGFLIRVRAIPLLLLMAIPVGLLAPLGLSDAAAVAVVLALLFLFLDVMLWRFFKD